MFYFAVCCIFAIFAANYNHHEYNYLTLTEKGCHFLDS